MADEIKAIDLDVDKDGVHFINAKDQLAKEFSDLTIKKEDDSKFGGFVNAEIYKKATKNIYDSLRKTPVYIGVDWSKTPDYTGRVIYWVAPFKYKTAGFDPRTIHSDFGMMWRFVYGYYGLDLKDLPINYNFDMAKEFYKNWTDGLLNEFTRSLKMFINSLYGKYIYIAVDRRYMNPTPTVYQDILAWLSGKNYVIITRGAGKHVQ